MSAWEIRKTGFAGTISETPYLGYSLGTLRDMAREGYNLYRDGKKVKLSDLTEEQVRRRQV